MTVASAKIEIRPPKPSELLSIRQLRYQVLDHKTDPPPTSISETDADATTIHMAAFADDQPVSTMRLQPIEPGSTTYLVRRMATAAEFRGQGIGSRVLAAAEAEAKRRGATIVMLHSRQQARPFYARSGYTDQGGRPVFHGNVHFTMIKRLAL